MDINRIYNHFRHVGNDKRISKYLYKNFKINIEEIMVDIIIEYVALNPVKTRVLKALVFSIYRV